MNNPSTHIERRGLMFVISSPSGAGKISLSRRLIDDDAEIGMSVSMTTRPPRPGEKDGYDYFFVDKERFDKAVQGGELLEWAEVFGNHYGTPKQHVEDQLAKGLDVLFDIDWQGTQSLYEKVGDDVVRVFILPPSIEVLEQRLRKRGQDDEEVVKNRMSDAENQISHWQSYDYVIINEDLDKSLVELKTILAAERRRRERLIGLQSFVATMLPKP